MTPDDLHTLISAAAGAALFAIGQYVADARRRRLARERTARRSLARPTLSTKDGATYTVPLGVERPPCLTGKGDE